MEPELSRDVSTLACSGCKRRKVKCDRRLPCCSVCARIEADCEYPQHPQKPGPKIGSKHKHKRKRRREDPLVESSDTSETPSETSNSAVASVQDGPSSYLSNRREPRHYSTATDANSALLEHGSRADDRNHHDAPGPLPTFSQIMYPSQESQTIRPDQTTVDAIERACKELEISRSTYDYLMEAYFANATSYTLFKPRSIGEKLQNIKSPIEADALVAAIFSFAARFHSSYQVPSRPKECPSPSHFVRIASDKLQKALDEHGDETPPLWILQTYILVTFYQLTQSVRSRSWRSLGSCVRIAYDMNLHLVDVNRARNPEDQPSYTRLADIEHWSALEERRRAWWAIWEMDVFASTIRRSPIAIDPSQNYTLLPVPDVCWFKNIPQESCFLLEDPNQRWKSLVQSGNTSGRAWYILVNSLVRNVQSIVYSRGGISAAECESRGRQTAEELDSIGNCLYCISNSLPPKFVYRGESLDFQTASSEEELNSHQYHADKYAIHLMTQLVRLVIHHPRICAQSPWQNRNSPARSGPDDATNAAHSESAIDEDSLPSWSNYMQAAQEIVTLTRNSSPDHFKYVNPFLSNTVWFGAAAQIACRVFRPPSFNFQLVDSNLDVLAMAIGQFIKFWNSLDKLESRLVRVEAALKGMMTGDTAASKRNDLAGHFRERGGVGAYGRGAGTTNTSLPGGIDDLAAAAALYQSFSGTNAEANTQGAVSRAVDSQTAVAFDPLLYEGADMTLLGLGQFFPYGVDELWLTSNFSQL